MLLPENLEQTQAEVATGRVLGAVCECKRVAGDTRGPVTAVNKCALTS